MPVVPVGIPVGPPRFAPSPRHWIGVGDRGRAREDPSVVASGLELLHRGKSSLSAGYAIYHYIQLDIVIIV